MIKLNFEESLSNLSLLNSTVTNTTTIINEQFNTVGSNINSALSNNITNAINSFLLLEQTCLNSTANMYNAFLNLSNNAMSYMSAAFNTISNGMIALNTSMAVDLMNIGADSITTANLLSLCFSNAFLVIGAQLIAVDLLFSEILSNIDKRFLTTANNAQLYFLAATNSIKENMRIIEEESVKSTKNSSNGWFDCFDSSSKAIGTVSDGLDIYKNLTEILNRTKDAGSGLTQILNINTGVQTTNTVATAAAGSTASSASLSVLSFGGGVLAMGAGVLLAGMALALLAKTVFNFLKMSGISTNGVKASDFNLSFSVPGLASGGFPSMGQMFIAREAGPELVGTIGGRNAVVNNNQIVESVSAGVYKAVREAMGSGNRSDKIVMTLDKKVLGEATIGYINGKTRQTGLSPILV